MLYYAHFIYNSGRVHLQCKTELTILNDIMYKMCIQIKTNIFNICLYVHKLSRYEAVKIKF